MKPSFSRHDLVSYCIAAALLILALLLHLLPALLVGALVYELVHAMAPRFQYRLSNQRARLVAVTMLSLLIAGLITAAVVGVMSFFRSDIGHLPHLLQKMADIIDDARNMLPPWIVASLPTDADTLRETLTAWLREHSSELRLAGTEVGRTFAQILVGLIIGIMVSLHDAASPKNRKPLAAALINRVNRFGDAFRRIVFAQVRISALNTTFTAIYIKIALPLVGVHLPFSKTMIIITFLAGLFPVIGNLISNTVIFIVSLANSLLIALASLIYLIVIHKLEYFLNARIVGSQIQARAWELLLAMLLMEAAFGVPGVIAAPIYYAYLKQELRDRNLV